MDCGPSCLRVNALMSVVVMVIELRQGILKEDTPLGCLSQSSLTHRYQDFTSAKISKPSDSKCSKKQQEKRAIEPIFSNRLWYLRAEFADKGS